MLNALPSRSMAFLWRLIKGLWKEPASQLIQFSNPNYELLPTDQKVEEEAHDLSRYYPVRIGDTLENRYQIVGKLGYGLGSTVWLANEWK